MAKLTEKQKRKLRQQLKDEHRRIQEWIETGFLRQEQTEKAIADEEARSLQLLHSVLVRQEAKVVTYEARIASITSLARQHSSKVNFFLAQSRLRDVAVTEAKYMKAIDKSRTMDAKVDKKEELYRESAEKTRHMLSQQFDRQTKGMRLIKKEAHTRAKKTQERINTVDTVRVKGKKLLENTKNIKSRRNSARAQTHAQSYSKELERQRQFKERILEKHMKLSEAVDTLNLEKKNLADHTRRRNLEMNRMRTSHMKRTQQRAHSAGLVL